MQVNTSCFAVLSSLTSGYGSTCKLTVALGNISVPRNALTFIAMDFGKGVK